MINIPVIKPLVSKQEQLRRTNRVMKSRTKSVTDNKDRRERGDRRQHHLEMGAGQDRRSGAERRRHINICV